MQKIIIGVGGMSCQGCVKNITSVLQALPGVKQVDVSLEDAQAKIAYDPETTGIAAFKDAIETVGFDVV